MTETSPLPTSPHLQVWRWTVTMATSIFQRATGVALYGGSLLLTIWLASAALGEGAYTSVMTIYGSIFGKIILAAFSWAISFHMLNGIRYLFADAGHGFEISAMKRNSWAVFLGSIILTALIWAAALALGV